MRHLPAVSLAVALITAPLWATARPDEAVQGARDQLGAPSPAAAEGWAERGHDDLSQGRSCDAADAYAKAVALAPENLGFRTRWGLALAITGDLDGALAQLTKVVTTPGEQKADAWVNLGWVYRRLGQPTESVAAYRKALEIDPQQVQAALGLGWGYTRSEEYDEAIAAYEKAAALDDGVAADAWWGCTLACVYALDLDEARAYERKMVAAGRNDPQLRELIDHLEQEPGDRESRIAALRKEQEEAERWAGESDAALAAVRSIDPGTRVRGARDLMLLGAPAVDMLIHLMRNDPDWNVRIAATRSLGGLGPLAIEAAPHMEGILRTDPYRAPLLDPTDEEIERQLLDDAFRSGLRQALARIEP